MHSKLALLRPFSSNFYRSSCSRICLGATNALSLKSSRQSGKASSLAPLCTVAQSTNVDQSLNDTLNAIAERRLKERTRRPALVTSQLNTTAADALGRMRSDVFRMGVVYPETMDKFLNSLTSEDKISVQDALFLLSCCGNALPECLPSERVKIFKKVWDILPLHGAQHSLDSYNARLVIAKENCFTVNLDEFLSEMTDAKIAPSQCTYELLIAHCSQQGNVKDATRLLELLREKGMPISERVFASLINGYLRANDEANAAAIEELMKSRGLRPGSLTYVSKLLAYAEQGEAQKIEALFKEVNNANIFLSDDDVLEATCILSRNGREELIDQVLANLRKQIGFTHKAKNASLRLASLGFFDAAYKVLLTVNKGTNSTGKLIDVGDRLLKHMVRVAPIETVSDLCQRMERDRLHQNAFTSALRFAILLDQFDAAVYLIRRMAMSNVELRPQYFWPLLCMKNAPEDGAVKILELMLEVNVPITMTTMVEWFWRGAPSVTVEMLSKLPVGVRLGKSFLYCSYLCHLMENADASAALEFANKTRTPLLSVGKVVDCLLSSFVREQNHEVAVALLERLNTMLHTDPTAAEFNGHFLSRIGGILDSDQFRNLLESMIGRGLHVSEDSVELTLRRGKLAEDSDIASKLRLLASAGKETALKSVEDSVDRIIGDFTTGGRDVSIRAERLLQQMLSEQKCDEAMKLYDFLKEHYPSSAIIFDKQIILLCAEKERFDEALALFKNGLENRGLRDNKTTILLTTGLVSGGRIADAVDVLRLHRSFVNNINPKAVAFDLNRLLTRACESSSVEELSDLVDALLESGYSINNNAPLVKCNRLLLANGELEKAVNFFENACVRFRRMPFASELLVGLIKAENSELLQRAYDLIVQKKGEVPALTMLVLALISTQRIEQAEQLLTKRSINLDSGLLTAFCRSRVMSNKIRDLESLLTATRHMAEVSRDLLYSYVLIAYRNGKNWRKAADAWSRMKEENFNPSRRLLLLFHKIFSESQQQPPDDLQNLLDGSGFADSEQSERDLLSAVYSTLPSCEVNALLNQGNTDAAVDYYVELAKSGQALPLQLTRQLFASLRIKGDYETMAKVRRFVSSLDARYLNLNFMIWHAMIESGNVEAFLKPLENNPTLVVPSSLIAFLLDCQPDLEERVKAYAERAMAKGNATPKAALWAHYVTMERESEAKSLLVEVGEVTIIKNVRYTYIVQQARKSNRPELVEEMLMLLKRHAPEQLSSAAGYIINLDVSADRFDSAKDIIKFAEENYCTESDVYRRAVKRFTQRLQRSDMVAGEYAEDANDEDLIVDKEAIFVRKMN